MSQELTPVWSQVEQLLHNGISVIPVRDKDEVKPDGSKFVKKSPYRSWKQFQTRIATKEELFFMMEQHNTTAVATLCGKISGNLEVIDIDVKWLPGIDARYFNDIRSLYPDLFSRLRIHKSPSGGYHLVYRVEESFTIPGNQKLGRRLSSDAELSINPKEKIKCFLETRGEGGYVLAPPSLDYSIHQDNPIPVLTTSERESLIALARCYDQLVKVESVAAPIPHQDNYYDTNPFEHFNNSPEGSDVLLNHGWKQLHRSGDYVHFNRPGSTTNAIHASFIISKRVFYIFTTNTFFENEKAYKPATALAILQFNNDKKATYTYLVQQGYGIIKPQVEQRIIKSKVVQGKPLPANVSPAAVQQHQTLVQQQTELHPHGIFWQLKDDSIQIDRESLYEVAAGLGFRTELPWNNIVQIRGYFIHKVTEREFFDALKSYIKEEDADLYHEIQNAYEAFLQRSGKFTVSRLPLLDTNLIIRDTPQTCYKFYLNGYLFITSEKYTLNPYENLAGLIRYENVRQRNFSSSVAACKFCDFLELSLQYSQHSKYINNIIGYLAHDYKDSTTGYIIVFTEQCEDPRHGGGSGKNLLASLLSHTTSYKSVPGAQIRFDESFMQAWDGERVFALSDVDKKFNFMFLKDLSTNDGKVKKLYKDVMSVPVQDMPKYIVLTNYSYEVTDGGLKRRIIPLEFTNFFTKCGGVDVHFKCRFPTGWTADDWIGYDNFIASSVQSWLSSGMKLNNSPLSSTGWLKQFEQTYWTPTRDFIEEHWSDWVNSEFVSNTDFNAQYNSFLSENNINKTFSLTSTKMNRALHDWADNVGVVVFKHNIVRKVNGISTKGREFKSEIPF
jgi:hypothetical protein